MIFMLKSVLYFLKRPYHLVVTGLWQGLRSEIKYRFPARRLKIIAITGTDGKTTSATLLYHILKTAGKKAGLITTVAAYIGDQVLDTGPHVTSPEPQDLQKMMRQMVDAGLEYLVLEATSQGIYQYRTWGIRPVIAGLTNIAAEHLDYHLDLDRYLQAKAILLNQAKQVVINGDDELSLKLKKLLTLDKNQISEFSLAEKLSPKLSQAIKDKLSEKYNQTNARLVTKLAQALGLTTGEIAVGISSFPGVPGRLEMVPNKRGLNIYIDFAHTAQAVENVLSAIRMKMREKGGHSRLITVLGCAGHRDVFKRPLIGQSAAALSDYAIFTSDDPRTENVWSIINQMKSGIIKDHNKVLSLPDRYQAISWAINKLAKKGDYIALLGKGHEQSIAYGIEEQPWDERKAVKKILEDAT